MKISSPKVATLTNGTRRIELQVGDFDLWYEVPEELPLSIGGEFAVCAGLLPAMARGETLILPESLPIDEQFRQNIERVQDKMLGWQHVLGMRLRRVRVDAAGRCEPVSVREGTLSFFSGGVDGSYTALLNRDRIASLVLVRGIDMQLTNDRLWRAASAAGRRIAAHWGLPFATVETNVRFLGYHHGLKWSRQFQGGGLTSVAHLTPFRETLIAASHAMEDMPPGASHPEVDPLWSSSSVSIIHDGAVRRTEKLRVLARSPGVMDVLRVCWHDEGYNCCRCEKCIRTMVALRLLGASAPTFPEPLDLERLVTLRTDQGGRIDYLLELVDLEREFPDPEIRAALHKVLRSERRHERLRRFDAATGGVLNRIKRKLLR